MRRRHVVDDDLLGQLAVVAELIVGAHRERGQHIVGAELAHVEQPGEVGHAPTVRVSGTDLVRSPPNTATTDESFTSERSVIEALISSTPPMKLPGQRILEDDYRPLVVDGELLDAAAHRALAVGGAHGQELRAVERRAVVAELDRALHAQRRRAGDGGEHDVVAAAHGGLDGAGVGQRVERVLDEDLDVERAAGGVARGLDEGDHRPVIVHVVADRRAVLAVDVGGDHRELRRAGANAARCRWCPDTRRASR